MKISKEKFRKFMEASWEDNILFWIYDNSIKTEKDIPIEFGNHRFLEDIYKDWTQVQTCRKASQIGFSTMEIIKSLYAARYKGWNIIYCVDEKTELLSKRGWLKYYQVKISDKILTLNPEDRIARWTKVREVFKKKINTELVLFEGRNFSALTTPNHRWLIRNQLSNKPHWEISTTENISKHQYLIPRNIKRSVGLYPKKKYSDEFVALVGWIITEGYYQKSQGNGIRNTKISRIIITQSYKHNPKYVKEIREIIQKLNINRKEYDIRGEITNFAISGKIPLEIRQLFPNKKLTIEFIKRLNKKQLNILIDTMVAGDGWIDAFGTKTFTQKNKETADNFLIAGVLAGYTPRITRGNGKNKCYVVRLTKLDWVYTAELNPKKIKYRGVVWCPRTENETFLAKRNGSVYWTGNSLPTFGDVQQFVPSKVNPIIANNSQLGLWVKDKDTTLQKQVNKNFIYYRGTFSKKTQKEKMESGVGIMLTSDLNVHDESDRSDQVILEQYESRLEASEYGGKWYFSNPTVPGTLTQKMWDLSDQKHWFVKCPRCNHNQWLDYYKSICKEREIFVCQKCNKEITNETRRNGFWVKKYRDREISGYWISHLVAPWITAKQLIESEATKTKQYFYNFNLGLPYIGSDVVVDREMILKNIVYGEPNFKVDNVIGVDTGLRMHYTLGNKQGIFKTGVTTDWDEIEFLMKKYNALAVFDALGDLTKPRKLRDKYRGRVWLCYFKRDKDSPDAIKWDTKEMAVYADRTKIIQRVIDEFVDEKMKFYLKPEDLETYIEHWKTLYQIEEIDTLGITRKKWETSGENHSIFSTIYYYLGLLKSGRAKTMSWSPPPTNIAHDPSAPDIQEMIRNQQFQNQDWRK